MKLYQRFFICGLMPFLLVVGIVVLKPQSRVINGIHSLLVSIYLFPREVETVRMLMCNSCAEFATDVILWPHTSVCMGEPYLIIAVTSHYERLAHRMAIRESWGNVTEYRGLQIRTIFVFGQNKGSFANKQLAKEHQRYGDVLQGDFAESYRHLTDKTLMILKWFTTKCKDARFILKADDDTFVHPHRVIDDLVAQGSCHEFIGGSCMFGEPSRDPSSKYYLSTKSYPLEYYPEFCSGPSYVMTSTAARQVLTASRTLPYVYLEDVFITGLCRAVAGLPAVNINGFLVGAEETSRCDLATWAKTSHGQVSPMAHKSIWHRAMKETHDLHCGYRASEILMIAIILILVLVSLTTVIIVPFRILMPQKTLHPVISLNVKSI